MAWFGTYLYRKKITISHSGGTGAGTNYQVKFLIGKTSAAVGEHFDLNGHVLDSFFDIRFTDNDETTQLLHWIESVVDSGGTKLATVWAKVSDSLESTNADIYIYYGKVGDSDGSDGANVFGFFDDFDGDLSKWTTAGSPAVSGGKVTLSQDDKIRSLNQYGQNVVTRIDFQRLSAAESYGRIGMSNSILSASFAADDAAFRFTYDDYEEFVVSDEGSLADSVNDGTYSTLKTLEIKRRTDASAKYITGWTKSGSNPLQDKICQNWFIAVYSNYNNEDKIYLFEQRQSTANDNTIEAWSFTRANASTPANWTDHGAVFTSTATWAAWIEPHGIIFETQSMADAREGVGVGEGTPKWRMYFCGKPASAGGGEYGGGFAVASENNLTSWVAYSGNPVYPHDATYGYADTKVCIYDNKVWLHHCGYNGASCTPLFFSYSDDGISGWTDTIRNWASELTVVGTMVPFSNGILLTGRNTGKTAHDAYFTTNGETISTYSGNPIIPQGAPGDFDDTYVAWASIVVDKNGSANLNNAGTYYIYYIGDGGGSTYKLGLATSTTLTEEGAVSTLTFVLDGDAASPWTPASNIPDEAMNIRIEQGTTSSDLYIYLVFVRKYASTEPAWSSTGEEESVPVDIAHGLRIASTYTPASSSTTGTSGQIGVDATYLYYCHAANSWKRIAWQVF